jgi:CheY-like chemotaxis protein
MVECVDVYRKEIPKDSTHRFDLVLLDYMIPQKNGGDVAREILAMNPHKKILVATAYLTEAMNQSGLKFDRKNLRIIYKPFPLDEMMSDK